ncbi:MAG TPA: hypothetical protein VH951_01510, partial [Dehalococcoidia bacterium]
QYRLVLGPHPCDICQSMEGSYSTEPHVPFHFRCDCHVETTDDGLDCEEEVRNAQSQIITSTETRTQSVTFPALAADAPADFEVSLGIEYEQWDDELLKEAVHWSPSEGTKTVTVNVPAGPSRTITFDIEITTEEIIAIGELWQVCRREPIEGDEAGGVGHTVDEQYLGQVSGGGFAITGANSVSIEDDSVDGGGGFFDDDDEAPS